MEPKTEKFDCNKITKYFKNQAPFKSKRGRKFVDHCFPPLDRSILAQDENKRFIDAINGPLNVGDIGDILDYKWKRIDEIFHKSLIFEDKVELCDINQGQLGNCYFLSALSALTEMPYLITQLFRTQVKNDDGYFEVVMFIDGEWQVVIIDDHFVVKEFTDELIFCRPHNLEIWTIILEKAWAKVNGGYVNTISGDPADVLHALTGFAVDRLNFPDDMDEQTKKRNWEFLVKGENENSLMCGSSKGSDDTEVKNGIVDGHAYSVISAKEGEFDGEKLKLLKLRNPWGKTEWVGDYSDSSDKWTDEKRKFFGCPKQSVDDGTFFMPYDKFLEEFSGTNICHIMYNSMVKSFKVDYEDIDTANVFNLYLERDSKISLSCIFRSWRFNRSNLDDVHPTSIIYAKYNEHGIITGTDGSFNATNNANLTHKFTKGYYVFWIWSSYSCAKEPKHSQYFIRIVGDSKYRFDKVGEDKNFKLIEKLITKGVEETFHENLSDYEDNFSYKTESEFKHTGISYLLCKTDKETKLTFTFDTTKLLNIMILPPNSIKKTITMNCHKDSTRILLGIVKNPAEYWFNVEFQYVHGDFKDKDDSSRQSVKSIKSAKSTEMETDVDIEVFFLNTNISEGEIPEQYYEYSTISSKKGKSDKHEKLDYNAVLLEELNQKFPTQVNMLREMPKLDRLTEDIWGKSSYKNGTYIGCFNKDKKRNGRGIYLFKDGTYTCSYWEDSKKAIWLRRGKDDNIDYEGDINSEGLENGNGKRFYDDGQSYTGEFLNGLKHGNGTFCFGNNQGSWTGSSVDGKFQGMGIMKQEDGTEMELEAIDDEFQFEAAMKNAHEKKINAIKLENVENLKLLKVSFPYQLELALAIKSHSEFNEELSSWEVLEYKNGVYVGLVDENKKRNGRGCYWFYNDAWICTYWLGSKKHYSMTKGQDKVVTYDGEINEEGKEDGKGTLFMTGQKYVGKFKNGQREGMGKIYFEELGGVWEGTSVDGKFNGNGTFTNKDGVSKEVEAIDDVFQAELN